MMAFRTASEEKRTSTPSASLHTHRELLEPQFLATTMWVEYALRQWRISRKLGRGADWTGYKIATAVRATPTEPVFDAFAAKRAFEGTDHCIDGVWR